MCLGVDVVGYGMVSLMMSSRDMLSCLPRPADCEGQLHGAVDALDSHEHGWSDPRKSQLAAAPTDTVALNKDRVKSLS